MAEDQHFFESTNAFSDFRFISEDGAFKLEVLIPVSKVSTSDVVNLFSRYLGLSIEPLVTPVFLYSDFKSAPESDWETSGAVLFNKSSGYCELSGGVDSGIVSSDVLSPGWSRYILESSIEGVDCSIEFYRSDENNTYKVEILSTEIRLKKVISGSETTIATSPFNFVSSAIYGIKIACIPEFDSNRIKVYIDNEIEIDTADSDLFSGKVAYLNTGANPVKIYDVQVTALQVI